MSEHIRPKTPNFVQFGTLTATEWLRLSVCEITKPSPQGGSEKNREGTPYDPRMGYLENGRACVTCKGDNQTCPGHFGHIVLPIPVYNYMYAPYIVKILQSVCPYCARTRLLPRNVALQTFPKGGSKRLKIFALKCSKIKECPWSDCGKPLPLFDFNKIDIRRHCGDKSKAIPYHAGEALNTFSRMSNETVEVLGFNHDLASNPLFTEPDIEIDEKVHSHQFRPESLIFTVVPVIPPVARPFVIRDGDKHDDDLTDKYNSILKACIKIQVDNKSSGASSSRNQRVKGKLTETERVNIENDLKTHIWTMMHNKNEKSKLSSGGRPHKCIHQRIVGKGGRVQNNVAGKRVNFSARSVIVGGGVSLKLDQVGVPRYIAKILTVPRRVGEWNIDHLQNLVYEGKINRVIRGRDVKRLDQFPDGGRKFTLMVGDLAEKQLEDDDTFVFNRQPSLRQESMLAFRAKIIDEYAFRLGLCWTKGYNADFDGDEMNLHVPQSKTATAEINVLMRAAANIVSAQKNGPVNGIVQDGLVAAYLLTNTWSDGEPETMVSVKIFEMCVFGADMPYHRYEDLLLRAASVYPEYISFEGEEPKIIGDEIPGKLAISILFPFNFCFQKKTDVNVKNPIVKINDGIVLPDSGPLCKKTIGSAIVHVLWKEYSPEVALHFLSDTQQFTDRWLSTYGFSMGISDCIADAKDEVGKILDDLQQEIGILLDRCDGEPDDRTEGEINAKLNSAMNIGLRLAKNSMAKGERNALNIMRNSGAKGSLVNLVQIVAFVGQQNIRGKRVPLLLSNGTRTLPHYEPGDHSAESRGFVKHGYLEGLTPEELFYHAMGGREGIMATALRTAKTGYIQKRISRKEEDLKATYDGSVRDVNGCIVQFLYGDDGLDAKKLCCPKGIDFPFFVNPASVARRMNSDARREMRVTDDDKPRLLKKKEINFLLSYFRAGIPKMKNRITEEATNNIHITLRKCLKSAKIYECMIPTFCAELRNIYESSKIQHGEMVGMIAASCIGEPTTQMTLNIFHFAGVKGNDVSLGVPRCDEILNTTASEKQKKPSCTVFFNIPQIQENIEKISLLEKQKLENIGRRKVYQALIDQTKKSNLEILQDKRQIFEETTVDTFLKSYKLRYLARDVDPNIGTSPVNIVTYKEYEKKWWVTLKEDLQGPPEFKPEYWVIILKFNIEEMFLRQIDLEHIASAIEEQSEGKYCCVYSPDVLGTIEVYCDFSSIGPYMREELKLPDAKRTELRSFLTEDNVNFFTCRDVVIKYIRTIKISGITGVVEIFPREDTTSNEWILDIKLGHLNLKQSIKRFLNILTSEDVDQTRTIVDDMHTIYHVYGIDAARTFIYEEMTRIISFDGTYVNPRHIELLADSMTYTGEISSVRRDGIPRNVGPVAKLMFEKSVDNALEASIMTEPDPLGSVASAVMYGLTAKAGAGMVDVKPVDQIPVKPIRIAPEVDPKDEEVLEIETKVKPKGKGKKKRK